MNTAEELTCRTVYEPSTESDVTTLSKQKSYHILPVLQDLLRLPVQACIKFTMVLFAFQAPKWSGTACLCVLLKVLPLPKLELRFLSDTLHLRVLPTRKK